MKQNIEKNPQELRSGTHESPTLLFNVWAVINIPQKQRVQTPGPGNH